MPTTYPVALFAHRRADLLAEALNALQLAGAPRIYAYVDGSRGAADDEGRRAVLTLLRTVDWAAVQLVERPSHLGLHASLRTGLDDFFAREEAGVVVEEDIRLAPGAYAWMCEALDRYERNAEVAAISAWTHLRLVPAGTRAPWWCARWSVWGWASWRRTWAGMAEPVESLLARLASERIDAEAWGRDIVTHARLGHWDAHFALACFGAHALTLYPPRSLADHLGIGGAASNQQHVGQWHTPPAAALTERWPWPETVMEHPDSARLWRLASVAERAADRPRTLPARLRRRLGVVLHRLTRSRRRWSDAILLRLALALFRARGGRPFEDEATTGTTPIRDLWADFLHRHRDAFFGRGLEIGDARLTTALGGEQLLSCHVVDVEARAGVDFVVDLERGWALPEGTFDVFLNQFTTHIVADDRALLWHSLRTLRPGGTLLVTFPCTAASPPDGLHYGDRTTFVWRWYTMAGVRLLLKELGLDDDHALLEPLGGPAASAAYLLGIPVEAMARDTVRAVDPRAPLLIAARITKPVHWAPAWNPPPAAA